MGPNSDTKTPETHNLDAQTSSDCCEQKRINMTPSQLFWDLEQAAHSKWAHLVHKTVQFLSLNFYVLCVLLWREYWLVIWNSFSFHFFSNLKNVPTFLEFGLCVYILYTHIRTWNTHTHWISGFISVYQTSVFRQRGSSSWSSMPLSSLPLNP